MYTSRFDHEKCFQIESVDSESKVQYLGESEKKMNSWSENGNISISSCKINEVFNMDVNFNKKSY